MKSGDIAVKSVGEEPAFARPSTDDHDGGRGIDTRTYIAAKAMASMITAEYGAGSDRITPEIVAYDAVKYADALIAELIK